MTSSPAPAPADADDPAETVLTLTAEAEALYADGQFDDAVRNAAQAANIGLGLQQTWLVLARACEAQGDLSSALGAYEQAAAAGADPREISGGVGRVALRLDDFGRAERLLKAHLSEGTPTTEAIVYLAQAQAGLQAFDRAHETLKTALEADPSQAQLWVALGSLLGVEGRHGQSTVFFEEGLRLDPASAGASAGLADALLLGTGDLDEALSLSEGAVAATSGSGRPAAVAAHALRLLAGGRIAEGWTALAQGLEPGDAATVEIRAAAPRWTSGAQSNAPLLLIGEDNLTDEILLAHVVPSVIAEGRPVILAVSSRLQALARRSFPDATVVQLVHRARSGRRQAAAVLDSPHIHDGELVGAWRPLRATLSEHRADAGDFADAGPYLRPDPARIAHWRKWLASLGPGPKVGVRWRQPALDVTRPGEVPALGDLRGPLSVRGLRLVSLQETDVMGELEWMRSTLGLKVQGPPGLDYNDLDDVAALACALDAVVGPPGVTTYVAAASGARTWFLATPRHWALLGGDRYPWFPEAGVLFAEDGDWRLAMDALGKALAGLAGA